MNKVEFESCSALWLELKDAGKLDWEEGVITESGRVVVRRPSSGLLGTWIESEGRPYWQPIDDGLETPDWDAPTTLGWVLSAARRYHRDPRLMVTWPLALGPGSCCAVSDLKSCMFEEDSTEIGALLRSML